MILSSRALITGNIIAILLFSSIAATMLYCMTRAFHAELLFIALCSSALAWLALRSTRAEIRRLRRWQRDLQNATEPATPPRPRIGPSFFPTDH
jgi:hypothetical protein